MSRDLYHIGYQCRDASDPHMITDVVYQVLRDGEATNRYVVKPCGTTRFVAQDDGTFAIADIAAHQAWQWLPYIPPIQMVIRRF